MTGTRYYPKADRNTQNYATRYPGSPTNPNVLVLHTTETGSWPDYSGGAVAPNLTAFPDVANKRLVFRQHFPVNMSSRALRNDAGGVETNTLNAVQIELVGTCAKAYRDKYGYFYWPEAPDWALKQLAQFLVWLHQEWNDFPLIDAAKRGWLAYPDSYGASRVRLTGAEWSNAYGVLGHQHVPENVHGDPGDFNIVRLLHFTATDTPPSPGMPDPAPVTRVQKARALLHEALTNADSANHPNRAARIKEALEKLPRR